MSAQAHDWQHHATQTEANECPICTAADVTTELKLTVFLSAASLPLIVERGSDLDEERHGEAQGNYTAAEAIAAILSGSAEDAKWLLEQVLSGGGSGWTAEPQEGWRTFEEAAAGDPVQEAEAA